MKGGDSLKKIQILITIAFIISIVSTSVYVAQADAGTQQEAAADQKTGILKHKDCDNCDKDPLKRLQERKELIQKEYKEGKITKEKADELTERIDKHIQKVKEFNSMSLPQKKEHLKAKFKAHIEKEIKNGKITKEEGDKLLGEFDKELEKWDGTAGFPKFMHKDVKQK